MIPVVTPRWQGDTPWQQQDWQSQLQGMIRDPEQLWQRLQLDPADRPDISAAIDQFPLRVTEAFVAKMQPGNWDDPLLLQILPQATESLQHPGFTTDPLGEQEANPAPGLIHKYPGRVLLITTSACAVHCRYCFRRSFPYEDNNPSQAQWQQALDYIRARPDIHEVILSGGDPLALGNNYLQRLIQRIADISHVRTLRLHSRLPLVLPARIDAPLLQILGESRLQVVMVIHCNHANELDEHSTKAITQLKHAGVVLLNQSVLLKYINDSSDALSELSQQLFNRGVLPYYLHLLDRVTGTAHFEVGEEQGRQLVAALRRQLPGYLVPTLAREIAGQSSKTAIAL